MFAQSDCKLALVTVLAFERQMLAGRLSCRTVGETESCQKSVGVGNGLGLSLSTYYVRQDKSEYLLCAAGLELWCLFAVSLQAMLVCPFPFFQELPG